MKILIIAPTNFYTNRGCHIRISDQAVALQKFNHKVKIVTYHLGQNPNNLDVERSLNIPWVKKYIFGPNFHRVYLDALLLIKAFTVARSFKPDILHCHLHEGALIGYILKILLGATYVFDSQGSLVDEMIKARVFKKNSWLYNIFYAIEKFLYIKAPYIVTSNPYNLKIIDNDFKISQDKKSVIPDMVKTENIRVDTKIVADLKREYNLERYTWVMIYLGWLNNIEGVDDLVHIIGRLKKIRSDFILLIVGHPNIRYYQGLINQLNVQNEIVLIRGIAYELIYNYYALGNFAITLKVPTTESNLKLLNYASAGLPIVCYDQASNRSIIGEYAYYLNYHASIEDKALTLHQYLNLDPKDLRRSAEKAREFVYENFSSLLVVKKLIAIYESRVTQ